jgi:hypothetical protein
MEMMKEGECNVREEKLDDKRARRLSLSDRAQRTSLRLEGTGKLIFIDQLRAKYISVD